MNQKSAIIPLLSLLLLFTFAACGGNKHGEGEFPENFGQLDDAGRVAFVMENATPDSVARFICLAALGKVPGARIDTLPTATLYAYENYKDSALTIFSDEFDRFSSTLPLPEKMKILVLAGTLDPQGIGYDLGLHYADQIREKKMTASQVREEIKAFREAADSQTYERFIKGFQVVLKADGGNDLPAEIYNEYK